MENIGERLYQTTVGGGGGGMDFARSRFSSCTPVPLPLFCGGMEQCFTFLLLPHVG